MLNKSIYRISLCAMVSGTVLSSGFLPGCVLDPVPEGDDSPTPVEEPTPQTAPDGVTIQYEDESNNVPTTANSMVFPVYMRGTMGSGDTDYFTFHIPDNYAGYKISMAVLDAGGDCFYGVDPYLEVLSPEGRTVLYHSEDSFETYCPTLTFAVGAGDDYLVRVGTLWNMQGSYTLSVLDGGSGSISGTLESSSQRMSRRASDLPEPQLSPTRGSRGTSPQAPIMPGELIVQPALGLSPEALQQRLASFTGLETALPVPVGLGQMWRVKLVLPGQLSDEVREQRTRELASEVQHLPGLRSVDVNRRFATAATPNDDYFPQQWDLASFPGMNMVPAWDLSHGRSNVIVAVGDTGHYPDHPDLKGKSVAGYDMISDPRNAGDGDGQDDDPTDTLSQNHGSHVAGTIAANTSNGEGVASVGWDVRYMPLRVCGSLGCTESDIADAIAYAAGYAVSGQPGLTERRADAINLSLGGHDQCSPLLQDVIRAANVRGLMVIVAAGNEGDDAADYSPASCVGAVAVGASNANALRSDFSNYGDTVAIMAPGEDILSIVEGGYAFYNGTSMATPHIAGLAGLLRSINPTFLPDTMLSLMQRHLQPITCGVSAACGVGVPDVGAVLTEAITLQDEVETLPDAWWIEAVNLNDSTQHRITTTTTGTFTLAPLRAGSWQVRVGYDRDGNQTLSGDELVYTAETPQEISDKGEDLSISLSLPASAQ